MMDEICLLYLAWTLKKMQEQPFVAVDMTVLMRITKTSLTSMIVFKKKVLFIYLEREHKQGRGRERKGEREYQVNSELISTEPDAGLDLTNCEIMTWAETKSRMLQSTEPPRCPEWSYF